MGQRDKGHTPRRTAPHHPSERTNKQTGAICTRTRVSSGGLCCRCRGCRFGSLAVYRSTGAASCCRSARADTSSRSVCGSRRSGSCSSSGGSSSCLPFHSSSGVCCSLPFSLSIDVFVHQALDTYAQQNRDGQGLYTKKERGEGRQGGPRPRPSNKQAMGPRWAPASTTSTNCGYVATRYITAFTYESNQCQTEWELRFASSCWQHKRTRAFCRVDCKTLETAADHVTPVLSGKTYNHVAPLRENKKGHPPQHAKR